MSVATPTSTPAATPAATDANSGAATRASAKAASLPLVTMLAVALILGGYATLAWVSRTPGVTHSNDDALYMLLGDQLTHFSYRETFKIGAPRHGQYPPLWPALLGLTQLLTGGSETARFLLVTVLMTAALASSSISVAACSRSGSRSSSCSGPPCNPFTINFGGRVMSEAAFFGACCACGRCSARGHETSRRFLRLAAGAALAAALTRTIGLTSWRGHLRLVLERRWRPAFTLSGVTAVFVGGWLAWTLLHHEGVAGRSYVADAAQVTQDRSVGLGTSSPVVAMARKVALRVRLQLTDLVPSGLPCSTVEGTPLDNVVWLAVTLLLGAFGAAAYWRLLPSTILYVVFYCGLLSVWPWAPRRFFVPLQPIVLLGFVLGVLEPGGSGARWRVTASSWPRRWWLSCSRRVCRRSSLTPARGCNAIGRRFGRPMPATTPISAPSLVRSPLRETRSRARRDSLSSAKPLLRTTRGASCSTRRRRCTSPTRTFVAYLAKAHIEYIVLSRLTESEVLGVAPKLLSNCEYLAPVRRFAPTGRIYRVLSVSAPAFENACADLSRLQALPQ
ncbi:MAG: hypothetical protein IPK33_25510 [Gemmatimonadetes bacterium]|nr:hypothetical protein [Gemmatimonadota bacterium]